MPPLIDEDAIDRLARGAPLVRAGRLRGSGARRLESCRPRRRITGEQSALAVRALARADRGSVLHRRHEGAAQHHRGPPGSAARAPADVARRVDLQADQGRRGRHLARERRREVFGAGVQRHVGRTYLRGIQRTDARGLRSSRPSIPAGTRAAPCTSTSRCTSAATWCTPGHCSSRDSILRRRLQARAVQGRGERECATPTTRSTAAAATARCFAWPRQGLRGSDQDGRAPQLIATPALSACWMPTSPYSAPCSRR